MHWLGHQWLLNSNVSHPILLVDPDLVHTLHLVDPTEEQDLVLVHILALDLDQGLVLVHQIEATIAQRVLLDDAVAYLQIAHLVEQVPQQQVVIFMEQELTIALKIAVKPN